LRVREGDQQRAGLPGGQPILGPVCGARGHIQVQGALHRQGGVGEADCGPRRTQRDVPRHHRPRGQDNLLGGPVLRRHPPGHQPHWQERQAQQRAPVLRRVLALRRRHDGHDDVAVRAPRVVLVPGARRDDPAKNFSGVCSNFLCDAKPGDEVKLTGPAGKNMLLPESENFDADLIMVATGTGIAPYRSMIRRLFVEKTLAAAFYKGQAWLFLGAANSDVLLFDDEWRAVLASHPKQFRYDVALSREQTNAQGGTMHIQDKMKECGDEIVDKLDKGAHVYFCGLKGMMPGILTMLEGVAKAKGIVWAKSWPSSRRTASGTWRCT
ncbi:hypothetical protein JKP88DRAFT_225364, partial [Tribonema minus]